MIHGGDIYRNKVEFDFSVNINPLGIPNGVKLAMQRAVDSCIHYPDIRAERLYKEIEQMTGIESKYTLCGNGASELFLALLHALKPKKTLIPVPSFGGYEYAAKAAGSSIRYYITKPEDGFAVKEDIKKDIKDGAELLFLANPGNPAGNMIDPNLLEDLLRTCLKRNIPVVADECFIEFTGKEQTHSLKEQIQKYPNLIIVRAFTKLFAIPGVRLGYLFCRNNKILSETKKHLSEWNVSVLAQEAGAQACKEQEYIKKSITYVRQEREFLAAGLMKSNIHNFPSEANYILLYTELPLYEALLKNKILIRDCSSFAGLKKGYYRVAVKKRIENELLLRSIMEI